jgi:hypothetical protein
MENKSYISIISLNISFVRVEPTDHKKLKIKNLTPSIFEDKLQSNATSHDQWKRTLNLPPIPKSKLVNYIFHA